MLLDELELAEKKERASFEEDQEKTENSEVELETTFTKELYKTD